MELYDAAHLRALVDQLSELVRGMASMEDQAAALNYVMVRLYDDIGPVYGREVFDIAHGQLMDAGKSLCN